jgi:hypothetical protein
LQHRHIEIVGKNPGESQMMERRVMPVRPLDGVHAEIDQIFNRPRFFHQLIHGTGS